MSGFGLSPDTLSLLAGLGVQAPNMAATTLPTLGAGTVAAGTMQPGLPPEALMGLLQGQKPGEFPTEAALLAGLGAAGMGLRAGVARPPAPTGSLPIASQPGRGLQAAPFRLPRGGS